MDVAITVVNAIVFAHPVEIIHAHVTNVCQRKRPHKILAILESVHGIALARVALKEFAKIINALVRVAHWQN